MGGRFGVAAGAKRCLDEVHQYVEGAWMVPGNDAGWADHARQPVGLLEIAPTERREPEHLPGKPLAGPHSARCGPAHDLVGPSPGAFIVSVRSRDHGLL